MTRMRSSTMEISLERKERSRLSPQLGIYKRDIVCYRSGYAPPRKKPATENQRDRKSVRCGCDAKMYLSKEIVEGVSQWFVVQFSNVHNHELLEDDQVRLLPAYRKIQEADQERIILLSRAGFPVYRIVKALELEKGIQGNQLPFLERDVRNFIQNHKKIFQESDASLNEKRENDMMDLVEACREAKDSNPHFVYDVLMDGNDKVKNIAWSYGDSIHAYSVFGDVVYFDTTYHSMTYDMLLGAWFGIDNHGKAIFFGCVLLHDDSVRSFSWALQTFIQFMKGRCPQIILTDLGTGVREAVRSELPNTKHVVSISNILSKLWCWFFPPLGLRYTDFRTSFDSLNDLDTAEEFELRWYQIIAEYGLTSDKHISVLFSSRACWALPFTRGCFLARMGREVYLKSVDSFLKGVFTGQACLRTFFEQVGVSSILKTQACKEMEYIHTMTCLPIEEHARSTLSPFAFNAFQHEMVLAMQYAASEMANGSFVVRHFQKIDGEHLVIWIPENEDIHCSCKEYESSGILCRHALRILINKNYFQLPEKYFLNRWRSGSSLNHNHQRGNEGWFQEFYNLTGSLFKESSMTKERCDFVHARSTLSPFAFNAFQHEMVLAMQYAASEMANGSFVVRHFQKIDGEHLVIWIPENEDIHCSCKEYESSGILCRHALRILINKNYFQLPEKYFLNRWRSGSSLNHNHQRGNEGWFQEFYNLTGSLFKESSMTKERCDFVQKELKKELTRILKEVKTLPSADTMVMD